MTSGRRWLLSGMGMVAALAIGAAMRLSTMAEAGPRPEPKPDHAVSAPARDCCGTDEPAPTPRNGKRVLRISADPNNLPFTNDRMEGFENKIAAIIAEETGAELQYNWRAQRRGFFRTAFKEGEADLVLGVPVGF